MPKREILPDNLILLIKEELNVKSLQFVDDLSDIYSYQILPNLKSLGPKYGKLTPQIKQALALADTDHLMALIEDQIDITLVIENQSVTLAPNDLIVKKIPREGLSVASDKMLTVALDITLTDELIEEGMAREVVRHIQTMRRDAGFDVGDRINVYFRFDETPNVFHTFGWYIKEEALIVNLCQTEIPKTAFRWNIPIGANGATVGITALENARRPGFQE